MLRSIFCWFRGHAWRYDGHVWGSGLAAHDRFVCTTCGRFHTEPLESLAPAPRPEGTRAPEPAAS